MISSPKLSRARGQTITEYLIVIGLVGLGLIAAVGFLGFGVERKYECASFAVEGASDLPACDGAAVAETTGVSPGDSSAPMALPTAKSCPAPCPPPSVCVDGSCFCFSCGETCEAEPAAGCGPRFNGASASVCCPPTGGRARMCNSVGCCCETQLCGYEGNECSS